MLSYQKGRAARAAGVAKAGRQNGRHVDAGEQMALHGGRQLVVQVRQLGQAATEHDDVRVVGQYQAGQRVAQHVEVHGHRALGHGVAHVGARDDGQRGQRFCAFAAKMRI